MKNIVVFTGAGISAESGIDTYRDINGIWQVNDPMEVGSPEGWEKNKAKMLDFFNEQKNIILKARPNAAHLALAELEKYHSVKIITQNIDDLHERAGSSHILHLHGITTKARSTKDPGLVYDLKGKDLKIGDKCEKGSQLRPHVVWFGEKVPCFEEARDMVRQADILIVVGTSLTVYPAAMLVEICPPQMPVYFINPGGTVDSKFHINKKASEGVPELVKKLCEE